MQKLYPWTNALNGLKSDMTRESGDNSRNLKSKKLHFKLTLIVRRHLAEKKNPSALNGGH